MPPMRADSYSAGAASKPIPPRWESRASNASASNIPNKTVSSKNPNPFCHSDEGGIRCQSRLKVRACRQVKARFLVPRNDKENSILQKRRTRHAACNLLTGQSVAAVIVMVGILHFQRFLGNVVLQQFHGVAVVEHIKHFLIAQFAAHRSRVLAIHQLAVFI